jgi:hypothetical protein
VLTELTTERTVDVTAGRVVCWTLVTVVETEPVVTKVLPAEVTVSVLALVEEIVTLLVAVSSTVEV